jgi:hypothetical protein
MRSRPYKTRTANSAERVKLLRIVIHQIATNVFLSPRKVAQALLLSPRPRLRPHFFWCTSSPPPCSRNRLLLSQTQEPHACRPSRARHLGPNGVRKGEFARVWRLVGRGLGQTPHHHRCTVSPPAFVAEFERLMTYCSDTAMRYPATTSLTFLLKS